MKQNFVAKHCRTFNRATVQRDRTKYHRASNEDWREEVDFDEEDWGLEQQEVMKTSSISVIVYKRSFINNGDTHERTSSTTSRNNSSRLSIWQRAS